MYTLTGGTAVTRGVIRLPRRERKEWLIPLKLYSLPASGVLFLFRHKKRWQCTRKIIITINAVVALTAEMTFFTIKLLHYAIKVTNAISLLSGVFCSRAYIRF